EEIMYQLIVAFVLLLIFFSITLLYKLINSQSEGNKLLAIIDKTTLLYNKKYFLERLENEIKRCDRYNVPLALILITTTDFNTSKQIKKNEYEDIIKNIALVLKETVRETDILSRSGENEFSAILPFERDEGTSTAIERFKNNLRQEKIFNNNSCPKVILNFGFAIYPEEADCRNDLLKRVKENILKTNNKLELLYTTPTSRNRI
ncbi:MAG: GGDEF domain-containing protein, partial [bacterium]